MVDSASRLASALADHYRIDREIGTGGMDTVYLAIDLKSISATRLADGIHSW